MPLFFRLRQSNGCTRTFNLTFISFHFAVCFLQVPDGFVRGAATFVWAALCLSEQAVR